MQPNHYVLACGDGNAYLENLAWTDWGSEVAKASGTYFANDCTPNCGAGTVQSWPATVSVSSPKSTASGWLFTELAITYKTKTARKVITTTLPTKLPAG